MSELKKQILSGVAWQMAERFASQAVQFIFSIVLARLLSPHDYGLIALVIVFITFTEIFVDGGFQNSLIQRKNATDVDFCSVFWVNLGVGVLLGAILFFGAPLVARFYNVPLLTSIMRVMALIPVIDSLAIVNRAMVFKKFLFHFNFRIKFCATLLSSVFATFFAWRGYGVWALVVQRLTAALVSMILLWYFVRWFPKLKISWRSVSSLFRFGGFLLAGSLVQAVVSDIYSLTIGKIYSPQALGLYNRGRSYPALAITTSEAALSNVLFSAFAKVQSDLDRVRSLQRKGMIAMMFVLTPILGIMCVGAEPLVRLVLTEKWLGSVIFLQIVCVYYLFHPMLIFNNQAFKAVGRSDCFFILQTISNACVLINILVASRFSVVAMVCGSACVALLNVVWTTWMAKKVLNYGFFQQMKDVVAIPAIGALATIAAWGAQSWFANDWLRIGVVVVVFGTIYLGSHLLFRTEAVKLFLGLIVERRRKQSAKKSAA